ncbi:helix-hairpin-helix domain-containing protein [Halorubrum sp. F4]|uniref:helix-hairpin-helix domain-containing protein n=1 Tax=Halorubrum sp. F4 TaxID=2989715 RepID=UPI00247FB8BE|nr:helix-hairpin-helix domain-containing protein [Halorubrum sp. F4]
MALLRKIKEKLGFGSDSSDGGSGETTVTVERDAEEGGSEPTDDEESGVETTASTEAAVEPDESDEGDEGDDAAAETDAEPADEDERADADDDGVEANGTEADETEAEAVEADAAEDAEPVEDDAAEPDGEPVDSLKGIGPAYGERLGKIGIETVEELAAADPAEVAEGASIGEKRAVKWIDRAKEF